MNRLTERTSEGILVKEDYGDDVLKTLYQCYGENPLPHYGNCDEGYCAMEKLEEYEDAEEQGKLLRLPIAVGDTVYRISRRKWCKFENDYIDGNVICMDCNADCESRMEYFIEEFPATLACIANIVWHKEHPSDSFHVFLAKSEAENALQKMNEMEGKE